MGGLWGYTQWETVLKFMYRLSNQTVDPILNKDTGFYLFSLPFYDALYSLLFLLALIAAAACALALFTQVTDRGLVIAEPKQMGRMEQKKLIPLYRAIAVLLLIWSGGRFLERYHVLNSSEGTVYGAGWTDVHVLMPAYFIIAVIGMVAALVIGIPVLRNRLAKLVGRYRPLGAYASFSVVILGVGIVLIAWFLGLSLIPGLFQWLRVEPNEITYEEPYIRHNIMFTRHGFNLQDVEEKEFLVSESFTPEMIRVNENLFSNIRLWDYRALDAVYKQFQEIRLYYEFLDVDIDRYDIDENYRQVMVSARELNVDNLPAQSQTFVNRRFKYTPGYGITLTTVSDFTPEGLPDLLIKDIPPKSTFENLEVTQPRIYYGESTHDPVIVNTDEPELDYPSGEENVYVHYEGTGGVQLRSLWRKFLFGWKFDGTKLFLSSYPNPESRIQFHRRIQERVRQLAPFLVYDDDPYIVLADGKLFWVLDSYTTANRIPYSEPFTLSQVLARQKPGTRQRIFQELNTRTRGVNYIRNSVKVVVDAYEGSVDFYVFEPNDPIIQVWGRVFPQLFKPRSAMPPALLDHIRYPADMLLIQGLVYAKYHMTDPTVFYNQEDLWVRATEKYYNHVQPVEPYYIMWKRPGKDDLEFVLILPFTPKNRQVMIGWIAGMCDPENYGRLLAYKFPKEKRILGPQQVETKIDQDRFLSGQLTLWDQRGSRVIRGNVLAIPVEKTILYVEPIYLQAETAAYPELRLVVVMHNDNLSYGDTFDEALWGLFEEGKPKEVDLKKPVPALDKTLDTLITEANAAFERYLSTMGEKNFGEASQALENLRELLQRLSERAGAETMVEDASP